MFLKEICRRSSVYIHIRPEHMPMFLAYLVENPPPLTCELKLLPPIPPLDRGQSQPHPSADEEWHRQSPENPQSTHYRSSASFKLW